MYVGFLSYEQVNIMKMKVLSLIATGMLAAPIAANAALIQVDFTVAPTGWFNSGTPFSMPHSPTLIGSMTVDNALSGAGALIDFSLTTGTMAWTRSDFVGATAAYINFDGVGSVVNFGLHGFQNALGSMYIYSNNTFGVTEFGGGESSRNNACNGCVSFTQSPVSPPVSVSEPSSMAMFGLALAVLGLIRRRRVS